MNKKRLTLCIISVAILVCSLVVMLCDLLIPLSFWTHPVLNFLFCMALGFGVMALVVGVKEKAPWQFLVSACLLGLSLFYLLIQYLEWWVCLIICLVFVIIVSLLSTMRSGNKTEDIALNETKDYKNYQQRREEKIEEESKTVEELPQIKSFKD